MSGGRTVHAFTLHLVLLLVGSLPAIGGNAPSVPLYEGMGSHHRKVSTSSPLAQKYFDQGLVWLYAFNHDEARRSFRTAAEHDPACAMAWWGIALSNGPHINNPAVPEDREAAAREALKKAHETEAGASPVERALIEALSKRHDGPVPVDRDELDGAYAAAMAEVWEDYPKDSDVGALYAESLMDLRPWDLWTQSREPQPGTGRILAVLDEVLRLDPDSPGANHLYIHAVEPSRHPEKANLAAARLESLVPASGHLVHMPSHIYVLTGRWAEASRQNQMAIAADSAYRTVSPDQGFYHVYMLHNHHMLAFASMMEGCSQTAIQAARRVVDSVPEDYRRREAVLVDPYMGAVYDVLKRFGRWDDILREPAPPSYLKITTAMWRMNRGVAFAAKGEVDLAEQERAAFLAAASQVPEDATMAINPAVEILGIAKHFLAGEIAYRRGDIDDSVVELRKAIEVEDQLRYMEPPEWMQPVRHTLGAFLLEVGRVGEAEKAYREDLAKWPDNGWSLHGLGRCLRARGATAEAQKVEERFHEIWSRADVSIGSSCLCTQKS